MFTEADLALFGLVLAASFGDRDALITAYGIAMRLPEPADREWVQRTFAALYYTN